MDKAFVTGCDNNFTDILDWFLIGYHKHIKIPLYIANFGFLKQYPNSFLVRMGSSQGRLFDSKGRKTRLKLSLEAWGYRGKSKSEAVALGRRYLRTYQNKKK